MRGDRELSLIRRAVLGGLVDPARVRLLDRGWWRWLGWVVDHVEADAAVRLYGLRHAVHCGALNYQADRRTFDLHWDQAFELENRVRAELFPWVRAEGDRTSSARRLAERWEKLFGAAGDAATQAAVRATCDAILARAAAARARKGR